MRVRTDDHIPPFDVPRCSGPACTTIRTNEGLSGATVPCPYPLPLSPLANAATGMCRASLPWQSHPQCVRDAPAQRCGSTGAGDTCRVPRARSPVQGQRPPQDWRCRCRRATIASPARPRGSPA